MLSSPPLLANKKELFVLLLAVGCVALFSLSFQYYHFLEFRKSPLHVSMATVLNHYTKTNAKGRTYDVFKLRLDGSGAEVYTTSFRISSIPLKSRVKVKLKVDKVSFYDYLKGFFAPSLALYEIYEDDPPWDVRPLYQWVDEQHENEKMAEVYKTLFFATPISKELRDEVQKWGISHLVAISGYNVGVISFLLFFFLKPLYRFFQNRYFPYRNIDADLSCVVFVVLFVYMVIIDFIAPFLRAFVMSLVGFFFYSRGIKVLSFEMLGLITITLLALFPSLLFSLSFWLSIAGVFYLFLFLHHFEGMNRWVLLGIIDLGVFLLMVPIVHTFFPVFTFLQLTSPLSSLVFVGFYPLGLLLHALQIGDSLDTWVLAFLHVKTHSYMLHIPWWILIGYVGVSLLAIRYKLALYGCLAFSFFALFFIE
ncbi:ComEC/Rec2 family competence protein [Sulfurospirillum barnesii]|uniref:ComEC/Rec2-related protein n=1 Tax=Sulfurospirillum barnesii (strain ATCC 700032 / DSM 10660 / SES-3) TaxID=760154 RepID=I3XYC5_SULBS|nr:ComEC/Rec2 family competence protein [Sulfurospirillum barnesii]AFL68949.1 ComEC/Rec2-related protein [Sulfurospirillum barnesii SES-3]